MVKKRKDFQEISSIAEPIAIEEATLTNDVKSILEEIKTDTQIIGYILRNSTSAAIDLKDPTKIVDYAILSSTSFEASDEVSKLFDLGETKDMVIEGKEVKVLTLRVGENKISVFLEKDADHGKILRKLHSS